MSAEQLERVRQKLVNTDEGAEDSESERQEFKTGVGLRNVYLRLKLFYREKVDFQINSKEYEGTVITIQSDNERGIHLRTMRASFNSSPSSGLAPL